ncbi:MAG: type II secretion system major pseudopilin GspG [Pseudomonadota bacterium]
MTKDHALIVPSARARRSRQGGFSLIELLVVLAIMAVLASLVGPRLFSQVDRSKVSAAKTQARSLKTSVDALRLDIGRYPTADEGLAVLVNPPADPAAAAAWFGPYIDGELPSDPWGRPFVYTPPATDERGIRQSPSIRSLGADGRPGGSGLDEDVGV